MIEAEALCYSRRGRALLNAVSCHVQPGEVLGIIGPNGAGKTTLLRLLTGEYAPDSGNVRLNGRGLRDYAPDELARVRGYLPQQSSLEFDFTASEVVMLGRSPHPRPAAGASERALVEQALALTGAAALAERFYTTLSGGEQQRVHLARVFVQIWQAPANGCRLLLLDEPTSSLDLGHQHSILGAVRRFALAGTAVIMVLHDLNLALRFADRLLLLHGGRALAAGSPSAVLTRDNLREAFGVSACVVETPPLSTPALITYGPIGAPAPEGEPHVPSHPPRGVSQRAQPPLGEPT
jgi:iron complex transport system ATP-binding protein